MMIHRDTDLAWAAGILDGEGGIPLNVEKGRYLLRVCVTNTNLSLLARMRELFGGNICPMKRYKANWKDRWQWDLKASKAEVALRAVLPYLVAKKQEADLGLLSRQYMQKVGANTANPNGEQLAWLKRELSSLKGHQRAQESA